MAKENAIILFTVEPGNETYDLEIPLQITANELFLALQEAFHLPEEEQGMKNQYLVSEDPMVLLKGSKKLADFGIRNGSHLYYSPERRES